MLPKMHEVIKRWVLVSPTYADFKLRLAMCTIDGRVECGQISSMFPFYLLTYYSS